MGAWVSERPQVLSGACRWSIPSTTRMRDRREVIYVRVVRLEEEGIRVLADHLPNRRRLMEL